MSYDSTPDTLRHSLRVGALMHAVVHDLIDRSVRHDLSKTEPPEVEVFNEVTPRLRTLTYGSEEYKASLASMGPALEHHYARNRHHPEHHKDGIAGMTGRAPMAWSTASNSKGRHPDGRETES